jgi:hypothetical protein
LAIVLAAATCKSEEPPATAKKRLPTRISASVIAPEVQDRLKLSSDQRKRIAELGAELDAKLAALRAQPGAKGRVTWSQEQEVTDQFEKQVRPELSPEQQKQWSRLKWLEMATFSGPGWAVLEQDMQTELKLADRQAAVIDELQKEFCRECERIVDNMAEAQAPPGIGSGQSPIMIKVYEANAAFDARLRPLLEEVLSPEQHSRWGEIQWQRTAERTGPAVLLEKSVIEYLALSETQQREIQRISDEATHQFEVEQKEGRFSAAMKIPVASLAKALAVLTPRQKRLWASLLGEPFRDLLWQLRDSAPAATNDGQLPE